MFGLPPDTHGMKIKPWLTRLQAGTAALEEAIAEKNPQKVVRGLEDVSFWLGRTIAEVFGAGTATLDQPQDYRAGMQVLADAQRAALRGERFLRAFFPSA
jgi:hypothetical protein